MQNIDTLNEQFGIAGHLEFIEDDNGFVMAHINNKYAQSIISTYAAQVISYQLKTDDNDLIFLSHGAAYKPGRAIRGGVPICWPWFGDDTSFYNLPSHGFARNQQWQVIASSHTGDVTSIILGFSATDDTRAVWPYEFDLLLEVNISQSLSLKLTTKNTGLKEFTITQALHTYFNVSDIEQVRVEGLKGKKYLDKLSGFSEKTQTDELIINQEVDRVYQPVSNDIHLIDDGFGRKISLSASGSETTVVWNPWTKAISRIKDLERESYRDFLCIETANAAKDSVTLAEGEEHSLAVSYTIS